MSDGKDSIGNKIKSAALEVGRPLLEVSIPFLMIAAYSHFYSPSLIPKEPVILPTNMAQPTLTPK
jgi:hypothetical protein